MSIGKVVATGVIGILAVFGSGKSASAEPVVETRKEGPITPDKPIKFFYFEVDEKGNLELKYENYQNVILPELLRLNPNNKDKAATSAIRGIGDAVTSFNVELKDLKKICVSLKNLMPPLTIVKTIEDKGRDPERGFPQRIYIPNDLKVDPDSAYYIDNSKSKISVVATDKDGNKILYIIQNFDGPIVVINKGQAIFIIPQDQIKQKPKKPDPGKSNLNQPTRWEIEQEFRKSKEPSLS